MPVSWHLGKEERKRTAAQIVYNLLPADGSLVTWSQLEKQAVKEKMSTTTLSAHLKDFVRLGMIERNVDSSVYPPRVYYSKREGLGGHTDKYEHYWKPTKGDLAKFQTSGGSIDEFASARSIAISSMLHNVLLQSLWRAIVADIRSIPEGESDKNWSVKTHAKLHVESKAHEVLDKEIDVGLRPLAHKSLSFFYSVDPRSKLPLIANDKLFRHMDQINMNSYKAYGEALRVSVIEEYMRSIKNQGKTTNNP